MLIPDWLFRDVTFSLAHSVTEIYRILLSGLLHITFSGILRYINGTLYSVLFC